MSDEIFNSLVQLYGDIYADEVTCPHLNSMVSSSCSSETSVWSFSSINKYQKYIGACTITVHYDSLFYYVDMIQIDYDNETVCVWVPAKDLMDDDNFANKEYADVLEDDFNIAMAIARDGFFDSGENIETLYDDDDEPDENGMVNIPLDLTDSELGRIARAAHKLDITINEFMNLAVKEVLEEMNYDYENL